MNPQRRAVVVIFLAVVALMVVVPPWRARWSGGYRYLGHAPLLMPPHYTTSLWAAHVDNPKLGQPPEGLRDMRASVRGQVHWRLLLTQVAAAAIVAVAAFVLMPGTRKTGTVGG